MIIFPLSHESGQVRRYPYITVGIIILNVLLFLITWYVEPKARKVAEERAENLFKYYASHPYLEFSGKLLNRLPQHVQVAIQRHKELRMMIPGAENTFREPEDEEKALQQEELNRLAEEFEKAFNNLFYRKYGYIPSEGGFFTLFSSMFLHGGFFHLFFNMFFLFLSGCNIEDFWGRAVYPAFYLIGGIVATMIHVMVHPESHAPLIGASGAIAALMGAFMVRLYKTKIFFFYFFFFWGIKHGTFRAPAYVMLPLWLVQQLWEAYNNTDGSDVAFWAHIGGFAFGALVAVIFKFTQFEEKFIDPAIEKKINLVNEDYASGTKKLQEGDIDGAVFDLRKALVNEPDNAVAHSELCKAYCKQGKEKVAMLEFQRASDLYIKQGDIDNVADDYLEVCTCFPNTILEPELQMEIADSMEKREMYAEAALTYEKFISHYKNHIKNKEKREQIITALTRYGRLCSEHLEQHQKALAAYKMLLTSDYLSDEQEKELKTKCRELTKVMQKQAQKSETLLKNKEETSESLVEKPVKQKPNIPIQKRIRLIQAGKLPEKYKVMSVAPYEANKVLAVEDGMNLNRLSEPPLLFENIYAISIFQFEKEDRSVAYADIFVREIPRPYRISSNKINYSQFLSEYQKNSLNNFRPFILFMLSQISSVYLDQGTFNFLKTGKPIIFKDEYDLEAHEKNFWRHLMGEVRSQCEKCWEVYWIDGRKVPPTGAKTKCKKCGHPVLVKSPQAKISE